MEELNFIYIASITMQIVSRRCTETQSMTPEQISLTNVIILNPNLEKWQVKKKTPTAGEKKTFKPNSCKEKLHYKRKKPQAGPGS